MVFAKSRGELVAATRALDRVLLWNHYVVPQYIYDKVRDTRAASAGPIRCPRNGAAAFPAVWWWNAERAGKTAGHRRIP